MTNGSGSTAFVVAPRSNGTLRIRLPQALPSCRILAGFTLKPKMFAAPQLPEKPETDLFI
jgi:hypothetical protein